MNSLLTDSRASQLHLPDIVGQGYGTFWRFKGRYRVCKGSRASKKSKTTALWYMVVHKVTHNFQGERHSMDLTLIGGEFISG